MAEYEPSGVDVGTGDRTITLFVEEELMGSALEEVRPEEASAPEPLPPPVYPMPVMRELKRVTVGAARGEAVTEIARRTKLPAVEVRLRLRIAELLGPEALAHVPPPKMSVATVERLRQLAFSVEFHLGRAARERGISKAKLEKRIARVRGLAGPC